MSQLEQVAAGALIRARPWDLAGIGLAAPMVIWGFLGWFGTVGDSAGGQPGFFSGAGAAGIGLVLAAAAVALNQSLAGRPHQPTSPPVAAMLAGAGALVILGGMIAKPDSATIQAGSVVGLLTALCQAGALLVGWLRGSEKSLKAANVRALQAQQAAADQAAWYGTSASYAPGQYGTPPYAATPYGSGHYGTPPYAATPYGSGQYSSGQYSSGQYGTSQQPHRGYPTPPTPRYPAAQYPAGPYPSGPYPAGSAQPGPYPTASYPPGQQYPPAGPYPGQAGNWPQGQYPYRESRSGDRGQQYPDPYGKNGGSEPSR